MQIGKLTFKPVSEDYAVIAQSVKSGIEDNDLRESVFVAKIDPALADTASFCEHYDISPAIGTNCLVLEAKKGDRTWHAACLVLAPDMAPLGRRSSHAMRDRRCRRWRQRLETRNKNNLL